MPLLKLTKTFNHFGSLFGVFYNFFHYFKVPGGEIEDTFVTHPSMRHHIEI